MAEKTRTERTPKPKAEVEVEEETGVLPILPVRDTVLFPHAVLPLTVGRESSVQLINSLGEDKTIVVVAQREARVDAPQASDLYTVGTLAVVHKVVKMPNQSLFVFAEGLERVRLKEFVQLTPFMRGRVDSVPEAIPPKSSEVEALQRNVLTLFQQIVAGSPTLSDELSTVAMNIDEPGRLVDFIASSLPSLSTADKQDTLETTDVRVRLEKINHHLAKELEVQQLRNKIQSEVQDRVQQTQREYYLREQMKAIQKELGEQDEGARDTEELREKGIRDVVQRARNRFVGCLEFAGRVQVEKRRALLDGQLVERQMLRRFRDRVPQFLGPHRWRLVGTRVNQIEGIAIEDGARDRHRLQRLARGMQASESLQRRIVQRLHAERHAVDARRAIAAEPRGLDAGRIGFQRDLDVIGDAPIFSDRVEDGADGLRPHQGRRAAAEENRGHLAAGRARGGGLDLARESANEALFIDRRMAHMAVEIAIRAFRQAKRPVHIDAEGVVGISAGQEQSPPASRTRGRDATGQGRAAEARAFRCSSSRRRCACVRPGRNAGS